MAASTAVAAGVAGGLGGRRDARCQPRGGITLRRLERRLRDIAHLHASGRRGGVSAAEFALLSASPFKAVVGTVATSGRGRGRKIVIPVRVNAPAQMRAKLVKGRRQLKSTLFTLRRAARAVSSACRAEPQPVATG